MDIIEATRGFEWWLRRKIPVVEADLAYKHEQMRADPFLFFRATFYRWAQLWPRLCPQLAKTHVVQTVGDLHLENFGTWRDEEGRLVWGVNDFDEAYPMAFANDLVRLATSALIASQDQSRIELRPNDIFEKLVEGYQASISAGGEPLILMEKHPKLREMATQQLRQPSEFWQRFEAKTEGLAHDLPDGLRRAFVKLLPDDAKPSYRVVKTPKGLGSLGRRRYLAVAPWQGGWIAREAKDVVPSACLWAAGKRTGEGNPWLERTVDAAVRCGDPLYRVKGRWLVRRLGPDCSRIDLEELKHHRDFASLLYSMGWETANIHLGTREARKPVAKMLRELPDAWLNTAATSMLKGILEDWNVFRKTKTRTLSR
jgi:hypothetical protein